MSATVDELEAAIRDLLDWQAKVRRQPMLYAAVALAAGFVAAGGPGRLLKHTYWLVRPGAKQRALANRSMRDLKDTLDQTIGGLPPEVGEQAKRLRFTINRTDPRAPSDGTIVIEHKGSAMDRALVRGAEVAAATAAAIITRRLIDEMNGESANK